MYANDKPDTAEHFVYTVSLKGIIPQMNVKIHRKLVKKFPTSGMSLIENNLVFLDTIVVSQDAIVKDQSSSQTINTGN